MNKQMNEAVCVSVCVCVCVCVWGGGGYWGLTASALASASFFSSSALSLSSSAFAWLSLSKANFFLICSIAYKLVIETTTQKQTTIVTMEIERDKSSKHTINSGS